MSYEDLHKQTHFSLEIDRRNRYYIIDNSKVKSFQLPIQTVRNFKIFVRNSNEKNHRTSNANR